MPQIDYAHFASQFFWLIVFFCAMYFLFSKVFAPKIGEIINKRAMSLRQNVADSEEMDRKTKKLETMISAKTNAIREEVAAKKSGARKKAAEIMEKFSTNSKEQIAILQSEQESELEKMLISLDAEISSLSTQVAEEVLLYLKKMYNYDLKI